MTENERNKVITSWCNSCGKETDHDVKHEETLSKSFDEDSYTASGTRLVAVRCRGCKEVSIRQENWEIDDVRDDDGREHVEVTYIPPRLWRRAPDWLQQLEEVEPDLKDILAEIYLATNDGQLRLLAMGVRTALDYVMTKIIGDVGDFPAKLAAMVAAGHLAQKQAERLDIVIDVGSAAAHRGFRPNRQLLQEMVNTMETLIRDHYLTGPMLLEMKKLVPPRPPRPPREKC